MPTPTLQGVKYSEHIDPRERDVGGGRQAPRQPQHPAEAQHGDAVLPQPRPPLTVPCLPVSTAPSNAPELEHHQPQHAGIVQYHQARKGHRSDVADYEPLRELVAHPASVSF